MANLLTSKEVCDILYIDNSKLTKLRNTKKIGFFKFNKQSYRYRNDDVLRYLLNTHEVDAQTEKTAKNWIRRETSLRAIKLLMDDSKDMTLRRARWIVEYWKIQLTDQLKEA